MNEAELLNYTVVLWTLDVGDWNRTKTADDITSKIFNMTKNGTIILLHDGGASREAVIDSLPVVIKGLKEKGFRFVTIDQMIAHLQNPNDKYQNPNESLNDKSEKWTYNYPMKRRGSSSAGRAFASQAKGRGFESRLPLKNLVRK